MSGRTTRRRALGSRRWISAKELTAARGEYDWLKDLPAQCAQQTLRQLDQAYKNWWNTDHRASAPTFKRKTARQGVLFPGQVIQVRRTGRRSAQVQLPKLGWVRFRLSRPLGGRVRNATISRDGLGWHVSFGVHVPESKTPEHTGPAVGVDLGIACSAFLSNETTERQRPATLTAGERSRLVGLERRKARQIRFAKRHNRGSYSNRLRRTISQIAALKARQGRRRADFNHKLTTDLAQSHGLVAVENLAVSNMVRTARGTVEQPGKQLRQKAGLNRSISDQGWHEIRRQLGYKTRRHGSLLVVVPAQHTSQWCAACGTIDPDNREGCGRLFACLHCGHTDHADRNAAINILARAISTAGQAGPTTSGRGGSQSTRSPHGQRTLTGSGTREPTFGTAA